MTDDEPPFPTPGSKYSPATPSVGEIIWSLYKGMKHYACELRPHVFGVEVQIRRGRELHIARTFATRVMALAWAEAERRVIEAE